MKTMSWHPDPTGRHAQRFWDGAGWTSDVADGGVRSADPFEGGEFLPPPKGIDPHPIDHKVLEGYLHYSDLVDVPASTGIETLASVLDTMRPSPSTGCCALAESVGDAPVRLAIAVTLRIGRRKVPALLLLLRDDVVIAWSAAGLRGLPTINRFAIATTTFSLHAGTPAARRNTPIMRVKTSDLTVEAHLPAALSVLGDHLLDVLSNKR